MNLNDIKLFIDSISHLSPERLDHEVHIVTDTPNMGGPRTVLVKGITTGFDWTSGKILLTPDEKLFVNNETAVENFKNELKRLYISNRLTKDELLDIILK